MLSTVSCFSSQQYTLPSFSLVNLWCHQSSIGLVFLSVSWHWYVPARYGCKGSDPWWLAKIMLFFFNIYQFLNLIMPFYIRFMGWSIFKKVLIEKTWGNFWILIPYFLNFFFFKRKVILIRIKSWDYPTCLLKNFCWQPIDGSIKNII